jgi:hypothetical protein
VKVAKLAGVGLLVGLWVGWTWFAWLLSSLMSLDEEWEGWGDVLLNPYIVGSYAAVSAVLLVPSFLLLRRVRVESM